MRTDNPTPGPSTVARLRAQVARAKRTVSAQRPVLRWSLVVAMLAGSAALAYLATPVATTYTPLLSHWRLSPSEVTKVAGALDTKQIRFRVDEDQRVLVDSERLGEARDLLGKLGVGPRSLGEIQQKGDAEVSVFDSLGDRIARQTRVSEDELALMIRGLDGVVAAYVRIYKPRPTLGGQSSAPASAFVYLETDRDRPISFKTVQSIQGYVVGHEPYIKHNAVTVWDRKGRYYLDATDPNLGAKTRTRAREEELGEKILEKLDLIKGVAVTVQIVPAQSPPPPPPPAPARPAEEVRAPVAANQPLELEPEARPLTVAAVPATAKSAAESERIRVWVAVPMSYYLKASRVRKPSAEELQSYARKTEELIHTAVAFVVPVAAGAEPPEVTVSTIADGASAAPAVQPASAEPRRALPWWVPAAAAGAVAAVLSVAGYRLLAAARRPAIHPAPPERGRFKVDAASEPGPSERVRELIRLNPEAAASVLHRWTGQGGHDG
jgi:flagellar biosynthesis/type III secretory pathway M-ring protein FliF/YscJ